MLECAELEPVPGLWLHLVASGTGLRRVDFGRHATSSPGCLYDRRNPILAEAIRQIQSYFAGERTDFELPLEPEGTSFQKRVWQALRRIPYGQTRSYAEIAREIGSPKGFRAVGAANGRNPLPVIVPCHRVIGADGSLTGFGGGLPVKRILLEMEAQRSR